MKWPIVKKLVVVVALAVALTVSGCSAKLAAEKLDAEAHVYKPSELSSTPLPPSSPPQDSQLLLKQLPEENPCFNENMV